MKQSLKRVTTLIFISGSSEVGERIKQHRKVIDACKASDVKHIVYTSFVTVTNRNSHFPFTNQHIDTENYLNDSGIHSVIIRNGYYMENFQDSILNALSEGKLVDATKEGVVAFVSRDDLACATAIISKM